MTPMVLLDSGAPRDAYRVFRKDYSLLSDGLRVLPESKIAEATFIVLHWDRRAIGFSDE
jgi:hypothetical protein